MLLLRIAIFLAITVAAVLSGSKCPPREDIYPCICINQKLNGRRQVHTTFVCQGLAKTDDLRAILLVLKDLEIDQFLLYDSFWGAEQLVGANGVSQSVLPNDWLAITSIKEFEVVDTTLSACFACQWTFMCSNTVTKTFKVINSTSSDKICTMCEAAAVGRLPWMACMARLENFKISHGSLKTLKRNFFPLSLPELKTLDLSHNQISKMDYGVFRNVPNITSLDLSHNLIDSVLYAFGFQTKLEYLDLSHNALQTIGQDLMPSMPKIKLINFSHNQLGNLTASDWTSIPKSLHTIDLSDNLIHCDCSIRFVNSTFSVGVHILGNCAGPDDYKKSRIRPASRHLLERCNANGEIGQRQRKH